MKWRYSLPPEDGMYVLYRFWEPPILVSIWRDKGKTYIRPPSGPIGVVQASCEAAWFGPISLDKPFEKLGKVWWDKAL